MLLKTVVECADFVAHSFIIKNVRKNLWRMAIHPNIECWVSSPYNVMKNFKITGIEEITKNDGKRIDNNSLRRYIIAINGKEIKFKSNYQFFYDDEDKELWGFDNLSHRRCYNPYTQLYVETWEGERMPKLEEYLKQHLKKLDLEKNIHYLEKHEQEEILESMKSEWQVYQEKQALPSAQKSLPISKS